MVADETQAPPRPAPDLAPLRVGGLPAGLVRPLARLLAGPLGLRSLQSLGAGIPPGLPPAAFARAALAALGITVRVTAADVPMAGGLVVLANHPCGGVDALAAMATLLALRPDFRFIADAIWCRVPELAPVLIPMDATRSRAMTAQNSAQTRRALAWLRQGHAIGLFPAGAVAYPRRLAWRATEARWPAWTGGVVRRAGVAVLPAWISGGNSGLFNAVSRLHPQLRHLLLVREMLNKHGQVLTIQGGRVIAADDPGLRGSAVAVTAFMREAVLALGGVVRQ